MSFFDWMWAAVAASIGWALAPAIVIAGILLIAFCGLYMLAWGAMFIGWCRRIIRRCKAFFGANV